MLLRYSFALFHYNLMTLICEDILGVLSYTCPAGFDCVSYKKSIPEPLKNLPSFSFSFYLITKGITADM